MDQTGLIISQISSWVVWDFAARNWALVSIVATVVTLVIIPAVILGRYVRIILNIMKDTTPPLSMGPRDFEPLVGEPVDFRALDGVALRGMFLYGKRRGPRKGMILFAHEFASNMDSCARYCRPLLEAGYDVFSFDFRGHGGSASQDDYTPRQWVSDRELADILGAVAFVEDWLERHGWPVEIGLFGISRGACAAILAAEHDPRIRCLICDGAFSTDTILEYLMKRWAYIFARVRFVYQNHPPSFWRLLRWIVMRFTRRYFRCEFPSVRKALMRMAPRPVFFIHGQKDSYIPVEQTHLLYGLAAQPKYIWIVPGAKHNQGVVVEPAQYASRTVAFFDRYLAGIVATTPRLSQLRLVQTA
ncbi:MAG: alpha/beta hydrolase [Phycisphaerae bacterium]